MRHESMPALCDTERVLEFRSASEYRPARFEWKLDRLRRIASRTALRNFAPSRNAHDTVVSANMDLPVVNQKIVGDRREPLRRIVVGVCDRLVGNVAAGKDDRSFDRFA